MPFFKRITSLISANLNDLIDHCEDPEKMLRQAVRDMKTALGQLLDAAARAIAHHKLLSRQSTDERSAVERHTKLAQAAVARGDDETARKELARKAEHQRLAAALTEQITAADLLADRLRRQVTAMRIKLAEARRKLVDVTARNRAATARRNFVRRLPNNIGEGAVWSNFETLCTRVDQSEAETEALLELLGDSDDQAPLDADIEAELRALKEAAHAPC